MDSAIILHVEAEASLAAGLVRAWTARSCTTMQVEPARARMTFGKQAVVVGLWGSAASGPAAETLIRILATHANRAVLLVCDNASPPSAAFAVGVVVLAARHSWEAERIEAIAQRLERGQKIASDYAAPADAKGLAPRPLRRSRRDVLQHRKTVERAIPQRPSAPADVERPRGAARWGYAAGACLGVAVVVALLGPWAADVATRKPPQIHRLTEAERTARPDSAARLRDVQRTVDENAVLMPDLDTPVAAESFGHEDNDILSGGTDAEWLSGGPGDDIIQGGPGDDRLVGGLGADWLEGEAGDDFYYGHEGADTFAFQRSLIVGDLDVIRDYEPGIDKIVLPESLANMRNTRLTRCQFGYFLSVDLDGGRVWGVVIEVPWATRIVIGTDVVFV